jgi:hypothetical protein
VPFRLGEASPAAKIERNARAPISRRCWNAVFDAVGCPQLTNDVSYLSMKFRPGA